MSASLRRAGIRVHVVTLLAVLGIGIMGLDWGPGTWDTGGGLSSCSGEDRGGSSSSGSNGGKRK